MLFDNVTLKKGMDFAAQLCAVHRQLSPIDLRDILLGCFSGLPIAGKNQCEYFGHPGRSISRCNDCPARDARSCCEAMTLDLLRRQRELDKRTGGAE